MALRLDEIEWGAPIFAPVADPAWEAEVKRRGGRIGELDRRVAPIPWLREACLAVVGYPARHIPMRLVQIGLMVTSQENSCRYCYGANRAYLKVMGYSESFIDRIERDAHLAELDEKERAFILFCRNLARSRPRPANADREALIRLGFTPLSVNEMAFLIASVCFYNRIGVLTACPPEHAFEKFANGFLGRSLGYLAKLRRTLAPGRPGQPADPVAPVPAGGPFGPIVAALNGLPAAAVMQAALAGAFESPILPRRTKALMFAVVARSLDCRRCERESGAMLSGEGFSAPEFEAALATLDSKRLEPLEARLLPWVRETVHYQTAP